LEEVYVNWGAGNGEVEMIGLTPYDDNQTINDYKLQFGVTNPCAGQEGNSGEAIAKLIDGQPFFGYPTYCVICPDRKIHFDICKPPEPACFDDYIISCGATSATEIGEQAEGLRLYPNPGKDEVYVVGAKPGTNYEIHNAQGQVMQSGILKGQSPLALGSVPPGLYFVKLELEERIKILKLIKE
jgi:hypothetical protein